MKTLIRSLVLPLLLLVCSLAVFCSTDLTAQNAPITTLATIGHAQPGLVAVPVTVTGFTDIGACSLTFDYQYAGLQYVSGTPNPALSGFAIGDHDLGNGKHRVIMGWFGSGTSLPDGSAIMTVTFTLVSGITALEFYDNGPACEYTDGNYNVLNDLPQSTYYINGTVCAGVGNPGPIAGDASVCRGETGIAYSVAPLANATSYNWSVPPGVTIMSGNNTNAITVDYSNAATSGTISVNGLNICGNGPASDLQVTVNPLPVANAGSDVTIPYGTSTTLHAASGGSGSFGYHWSPETLLVNPNLQDPQTVNLTVTEVFTMVVTNQVSLCHDSDEVIVTITGGPLNANPVSMPNTICHGTPAQLFANAGGGSGNFTYTWSCTPPGNPAWTSTLANPIVYPDTTTVYLLSLSDGFNTTTGNTVVTVHQLPSATIHGGDTLCGSGNSTVLTVDLTGTPPWSFYYSNGITTWYVPAQYTTPYFIVAAESGIYTILAVTDEHCTGTASGSAVVAVFPVPPTPVIAVNGTELSSSGCCGNQWHKDGVPVAGATNQNFEPQATAHYFTIVTVNGCSSDTSNTIYYLMTGIRQHDESNFSIEPNPASDFVTVKSKSGNPFAGNIKIYSVSGRNEAATILKSPAARDGVLIDIRHLSGGLYFLEINQGSERTVLKLVVQQDY